MCFSIEDVRQIIVFVLLKSLMYWDLKLFFPLLSFALLEILYASECSLLLSDLLLLSMNDKSKISIFLFLFWEYLMFEI